MAGGLVNYIYIPNKHCCYVLKGKEMLYNDDVIGYRPYKNEALGISGAAACYKFPDESFWRGPYIEVLCFPDTIIIPTGEEWYVIGIHDGAFNPVLYQNFIKKIILPPHLAFIGEGAFMNFAKIEEIVLPSSLKAIRSSAFIGCDNLKIVTLKGVTPPTLDDPPFPETIEKIIVPKGSIETYKSQPVWSDYADKIIEED